MRNLDECKAEIFRRSEERIKKRKRINIILTSEISVAACAIIIACAVRWISTISFSSDKAGGSGPQYSAGNSVLEDKDPGAEEEMSVGDSNQEMEQTMGSLTSVSIEYSTQYIRTDAAEDGGEYPVVKIIRSVEELKAYYEANKDIYYLERREDFGADNTIGFLDACDKYDEAYFEKQILVMVLLGEYSGSIRHKLNKVELFEDDGIYGTKQMTVEIDCIIPEIMTWDMAQWHILIEPEAGIDVNSEADISVILNDIDE